MTKPRIDAPILDQAPTADKLTDYDRLHLITYIRLLDADTDGIPWEEASRLILLLTLIQSPSAPNVLIIAIWRERSG